METITVKLLETFKEYEKGKSYDIDSDTAEKWIEAEVATKANPSDLFDAKLAEVEERIAKEQDELLKSVGDIVEDKVKAIRVAEPQQERKSFGKFLKAVAMTGDPSNASDGKAMLDGEFGSKLLSGSSGGAGGYLIPEEFRAELYKAAVEQSFAQSRVFNIPMATDTVKIPALDQTGTSSGVSNYLGGIYAEWTEDDASKPEHEPTFKELTLQARELSFSTKVHSYLLNDSPISVESMLRELFAQAIAWHIDYAILRGDGVGKPLGITASGARLGQSRASSDLWTDCTNMLAKLLPQSHGRAVWIMSVGVMPSLLRMDDGGSNAVFLPNVTQGVPMTLFGIPVIFTEKLPGAASANDVMLCDFSQYALGVRQELAIAVSEHVDFLKGRVAYRVTARLDGQPMLSGPITLSDGSTTVSPFVGLNA